MANEREITIKISAANLTQAGFDQARRELLGLKENTDRTSSSATNSLGPSFRSALGVIGTAAAAAGTALVALGAGVLALGDRGSEVADLSGTFDVLNDAIGNNATSLTRTLRQAFRGTVEDAEIFRASNLALSQGLQLNEEQFRTTALGARVLADRLGTDTVDAYEKLLAAMATGKDRQIEEIGLQIDGKAAIEAYAASLGVEASALSESEQAVAKKNAILAELQHALEVSGEAEVDFSDRIAQAKTWLFNLRDEMGMAIADSPVLASGFDGIATALGNAFGTDSQGLAETIVGLIEDAAIVTMDFAQAGLSSADAVIRAFYQVRAVLFDALAAIVAAETGMREMAAGALESAAAVPGVGRAFAESAREARESARVHAAVRDSLRETAAEAHRAADGQNTLSRTIQTLKGGLADARDAMVRANVEQARAREATDGTTASAGRAIPVVRELGETFAGAGGRARGAAGDLHIITGELDNITRFQIAGILNPQLVDFQTATGNAAGAMGELSDMLFRSQGRATEFNNFLTNEFVPDFSVGLKAPVEEAEPRIGSFFSTVFGGASELGSSVSSIFQAAFEGGGGALGAVKSFATQAMSNLLGMIPGVGPFVSAFAGPIIEMFGRLIGKARDFFRELFGGPSRAELNDRNLVAEWEDQVISSSEAAQNETERWRQVVVAVTEAYARNGLSAEEAARDVERLWASSREGGEESWRVIDEVNRKMQEAAAAAADGVDAINRAVRDLPDVVDIEIRGRYSAPEIPDGGGRYGVGTKGVHGTWFHAFRPGQLVRVDPDEAIVPRARTHEFIRDVVGSTAPAMAMPPPAVYIVNDFSGAREVTEAEFRQIQSRLSQRRLVVPRDAVVAR